MAPSRRQLLKAGGAGLAATVAGCLGGENGSNENTPETTMTETEARQTADPTNQATAEGHTDTPADNNSQNNTELTANDYRELNEALEPKPVGTNVRNRKTMKEDLVTINDGYNLIKSYIHQDKSIETPFKEGNSHIMPGLPLSEENIITLRDETAGTGSNTTKIWQTRPLVSPEGEARTDLEADINPNDYESDQELAEALAHQVNDKTLSERSDLEKIAEIDDHWTRYEKTDLPVVVEAVGNEIIEHIDIDDERIGEKKWAEYEMEEGIELMRQTYQGEEESAMEKGGTQEALYREARRLINGESEYIEGNFSKVGVEWHGNAHENYDGSVSPLQDRRTVGIKKNGELERVH